MVKLPAISLRRVNHVLFGLTLLIDCYIIAAPFLPGIVGAPVSASPATVTRLTQKVAARPQQSQPNQLIIPGIQLDQTIHEGQDTYGELAKGVWRWPGGSTPDQGSNTVLLGHRFTYTDPEGVFYFLDKIKVGDSLGLIWNNESYSYKVVNVSVVTPDHVEILKPTMQPTLTVYTCTPTWWPKDRLVITARLESHT